MVDLDNTLFFFFIANLRRLEALSVSNDSIVENLQSQITTLQQKIKLLEQEKSELRVSQGTTNDYQLTQIRSLEKVKKKIKINHPLNDDMLGAE